MLSPLYPILKTSVIVLKLNKNIRTRKKDMYKK